jgi:hypothetical protein
MAWTEELSRFCFHLTVYLVMSLDTKRLAQCASPRSLQDLPQTRLFFRMLSALISCHEPADRWFCLDVIREDYAFP